jgi:hypothetical protein
MFEKELSQPKQDRNHKLRNINQSGVSIFQTALADSRVGKLVDGYLRQVHSARERFELDTLETKAGSQSNDPPCAPRRMRSKVIIRQGSSTSV